MEYFWLVKPWLGTVGIVAVISGVVQFAWIARQPAHIRVDEDSMEDDDLGFESPSDVRSRQKKITCSMSLILVGFGLQLIGGLPVR